MEKDAISASSIEVYKVHLEAFIKVSTAANGSTNSNAFGPSSSAQKSVPWTSFTLKELTVSPIYLFLNVPSTRAATLEFFGAVINEHVNISLWQAENTGVADAGNIDDALNEIDTAMHQDLRDRSGQWCLQIFEWSLETLADISKKHSNRRAFAGGLSDILQFYTSCRSTRFLLELLNECVGRLLTTLPEQCIAGLLETTARYGSYCDWILTFIGTKYPKAIIDKLLSIGAVDFQAFVTDLISKQTTLKINQLLAKQEQYQREKLVSLSGIIGHLAHQQSVELRRQLTIIIQDGLSDNASQNQLYALAFVIKVASLSPDVADMLLRDMHHSVTPKNIAVITRIFSQIPHVIVFGDQSPAHLLIKVILALKENTMRLLYDKILALAFENMNLDAHDSRANTYVIQKYASSILDALTTTVERDVHSNVAFSYESTPLLNEINKNLSVAIERLFSNNELQQNYYFKSLCLLCFVRNESKTVDILSNILFRAADEKQLGLFVAFCRILHPVHQKCVENVFVKLPEHRVNFQERSICENVEKDEKQEFRWLENFRILLLWEQDILASKEPNLVNLIETFMNNYSTIIDYLIPLMSIRECAATVVDILTIVGQPVHLPPLTVLRLTTAFALLLFDTLKNLDTQEGLDLHKAFLDYFVMFVHGQTGYAVEIALRTLLAKALNSKAEKTNAGFLNKIFSLRPLSPASENESKLRLDFAQLLADNREMGGDSESSVQLIHSGTIKRRKLANSSQLSDYGMNNISDTGLLRKLAFVRTVDRLCVSPRSSTSMTTPGISQSSVYSLDVCRQLATLIVENFCPDIISSDHSWEDWDTAKFCIERLLAISKRVDEAPFSWDLLLIVSEAYPCLWFCLPIIKAVLGAILAQSENAVDKTMKTDAKTLRTLDKLFLILYKGRLIPLRLAHAFELLKHVSIYETSCILAEVWRYLQTIAPDSKSLQHHFECIQCNVDGFADPISGDIDKHLSVILLVLQANIAETGYLLTNFIDLPLETDIA